MRESLQVQTLLEMDAGTEDMDLKAIDKSSYEERGVKKRKRKNSSFQEHFNKLTEFKNKFGHCNVPSRYAENPPLGHWCSDLRGAYNQLQQGKKPRRKLSEDQSDRLEKLGFKWKVHGSRATSAKDSDELSELITKIRQSQPPYQPVAGAVVQQPQNQPANISNYNQTHQYQRGYGQQQRYDQYRQFVLYHHPPGHKSQISATSHEREGSTTTTSAT